MEVQYPLVFFTLLLCVCSGMFALQGYLLIKGAGTKRFHVVMLVVEAVALVLGGFSSFLHLHHWERIFNGFGHLSSGITQELIGIVVIAVWMVVVFVMLRRAGAEAGVGGADASAGAGAGAAVGRLIPVWAGVVALIIGIVMGFVCAHSYYMVSRPAWANPTLYLYYYANEFVLGVVGTWLVAAALKEDEALCAQMAKLAAVAGAIMAVATIVCGFYYTTIRFGNVGIAFHTTDPTAPAANPESTLASLISGGNALLFWGGAVVLGALAALASGLAGMKKPGMSLPAAAIAFACTLVGGVCFRICLYVVGIVSYVYF